MAAQCMYLNTLSRLFRGGLRSVSFTLPSPVTFREAQGEVRILDNALPDNRLLVLPLTHDTPACEAIAQLSDRVGGQLNGRAIELGVRDIQVLGDEVLIPFFGLEGELAAGLVRNVVLTVEII
jgi:hypothetical protein